MRIAPMDIVDAACAAEHIPPSRIFTRSRKSSVARARQIAMYLCRRVCGMSFPRVGMFFERHHATVVHACTTVEARISGDVAFGVKVHSVREAALRAGKAAA